MISLCFEVLAATRVEHLVVEDYFEHKVRLSVCLSSSEAAGHSQVDQVVDAIVQSSSNSLFLL
jgi:hypothetical protein